MTQAMVNDATCLGRRICCRRKRLCLITVPMQRKLFDVVMSGHALDREESHRGSVRRYLCAINPCQSRPISTCGFPLPE